MTTHDSFETPWKGVLKRYLIDFLAFFFPLAHAEIDWSRGYRWLDTELEQVLRDAELGRQHTDLLVEVQRRDGASTLLYIHVELPNQSAAGLAERMFACHYRLHDRFRQPIASLAVLGDEQPGWQPTSYGYGLWECTLGFRFPAVKLLDYVSQRATLERDTNPFATVVLAHLAAQETRQNEQQRASAKIALMRRLYEQGYARQASPELFACIDWQLRLPDELEAQVWEQIKQFETEGTLSSITTVEQRGRTEGRIEDLLADITLALELKFGADGLALLPELRQIADSARLEAVLGNLKTAVTLAEVHTAITTPAT